jgi:hypothetical protein
VDPFGVPICLASATTMPTQAFQHLCDPAESTFQWTFPIAYIPGGQGAPEQCGEGTPLMPAGGGPAAAAAAAGRSGPELAGQPPGRAAIAAQPPPPLAGPANPAQTPLPTAAP